MLGDVQAGEGEPGSMEQGHRPIDGPGGIEQRGQEIESKGYEAHYPWEDTPTSLAGQREGLRLWALVPQDPRHVRWPLNIKKEDKYFMNSTKNIIEQQIHGWPLPPGTWSIIVRNFDNEGKYGDNGGNCCGSFSCWQPRS